VPFSFLQQLHKSLKRLLREVIMTADKPNQKHYLKLTYGWFMKQMRAQGLISEG